MKNIWFTADQHFNHKNIIKYSKRPFKSVEEMNEGLIEKYNSVVNAEDDVYFLGDLGFFNNIDTTKYDLKPIVSRLKGRKFLILGNHDKYNDYIYTKAGFEVLSGNNKNYTYTFMYNHQYRYLLLHSPYLLMKEIYKDLVDMPDSYNIFWEKYFCAHLIKHRYLVGHVHTAFKKIGNILNVGVDCFDYKPVNIDEINNLFINSDHKRMLCWDKK